LRFEVALIVPDGRLNDGLCRNNQTFIIIAAEYRPDTVNSENLKRWMPACTELRAICAPYPQLELRADLKRSPRSSKQI
jgi:hypothetical protein